MLEHNFAVLGPPVNFDQLTVRLEVQSLSDRDQVWSLLYSEFAIPVVLTAYSSKTTLLPVVRKCSKMFVLAVIRL